MNRNEAETVLKLLTASFYRELAEDEVIVWFDTLSTVSYVHGQEAVRQLRETCKFMPSHAEFFEVVKSLRRRDTAAMQAAPQPALAVPLTSREQNIANVRKLRELLANVGKEKQRHDHDEESTNPAAD